MFLVSIAEGSKLKFQAIDQVDQWGWRQAARSHRTWLQAAKQVEKLGHPGVSTALALASALVVTLAKDWSTLTVLLLASAGGSQVAVEPLRRAIKRERPDPMGYQGAYRYSLPSGHAAALLSVYGFLAVVAWYYLGAAWGGLLLSMATVWILAVGYSRVYLLSHWATDVLAGWLVGLVLLAVYCLVLERWS